MVSLLRTHGFINKFLLSIGLINQPLDMLYNLTAMVIGFTYTLIPLMVLSIYLSLFKIKSAVIEAAKDLGANNTQIFFFILLPLSYGGIVSGSSMVLLSSLSMFYLSDILGGSKYNLVGNLIKNKFLLSHDWQLSCSISLIFYVVAAFFLVLQKRTLSFKLPSS
jgi:spermidine/putrescine transport system permease protein